MSRVNWAVGVLVLLACLGGSPARAVEPAEAPALTSSASLTGLWIGNVAGGLGRGGMYNTLGVFSLDADVPRLVPGWRGAHAYASVDWIRGRSATWEYVGDVLTVSNLDGFDSIRLYEAWLEQRVAGRAALRAGVLAADGEFATTESGGWFGNGGFGWTAGIGANVVNGGPIYFAPALGVRAELAAAPGWWVRAGVWDGDSFDSPDGDPLVNEHGVHFDLSPGQGRFWIAELEHRWDAGDDSEDPPGVWKLGAWGHTADFADARFDAAGVPFATSGREPAVHHGIRGAYGLLEQRLWCESGDRAQGLTAWGRIAVAPEDRSAFSRVSDAGLAWTGPWPGRDQDVLGFGMIDANVSPAVVLAAIDADGPGGPLPDYERVFELAYRVRIGERWSVTPDVQWVRHPGASGAIPDAVVPSLRVTSNRRVPVRPRAAAGRGAAAAGARAAPAGRATRSARRRAGRCARSSRGAARRRPPGVRRA